MKFSAWTLLASTLLLAPAASADGIHVVILVDTDAGASASVEASRICIFISPPDMVEVRPCPNAARETNPQAPVLP